MGTMITVAVVVLFIWGLVTSMRVVWTVIEADAYFEYGNPHKPNTFMYAVYEIAYAKSEERIERKKENQERFLSNYGIPEDRRGGVHDKIVEILAEERIIAEFE